MPFQDFNDYGRSKKEFDPTNVYMKSALLGVGIFIALLVSVKLLRISIKFIIKHWVIILGIIAVFFVLKKIFSKKTVIMQRENENPIR